jgi:hypothetical protein
MSYDFISLHKLGVGLVLLRYSEIILMEPTHNQYTRLDLSFGEHIIVEEGPVDILRLIKNAELLAAAEEEASATTTKENTPSSRSGIEI